VRRHLVKTFSGENMGGALDLIKYVGARAHLQSVNLRTLALKSNAPPVL
jgi:hypothetical protein